MCVCVQLPAAGNDGAAPMDLSQHPELHVLQPPADDADAVQPQEPKEGAAVQDADLLHALGGNVKKRLKRSLAIVDEVKAVLFGPEQEGERRSGQSYDQAS